MLVWWEWLSLTGWLGVVISVAMRPTIHIAPSEENFWAFQDTRLPLHYDYSCKLLRGRLSLDLDSRLVSFIVGWLVWYWELDPEPWACQAEPLSLHPSHVPNPGLTSLHYRCTASHWTRHKLKISILAAYRVSWELRSTAKRGKHVMKLSAHGFTARGHPFWHHVLGCMTSERPFSIKSNFLFQDVLERELGSCHPLWLRGLWAVKTTNQKKKSWKHLRLFQTICFWPEPASGILPNSRTGR